jgi:hypothetical protein
MKPKLWDRTILAGVLIGVYCVLYYPARIAGKFSDWFNKWDIETFGW